MAKRKRPIETALRLPSMAAPEVKASPLITLLGCWWVARFSVSLASCCVMLILPRTGVGSGCDWSSHAFSRGYWPWACGASHLRVKNWPEGWTVRWTPLMCWRHTHWPPVLPTSPCQACHSGWKSHLQTFMSFSFLLSVFHLSHHSCNAFGVSSTSARYTALVSWIVNKLPFFSINFIGLYSLFYNVTHYSFSFLVS